MLIFMPIFIKKIMYNIPTYYFVILLEKKLPFSAYIQKYENCSLNTRS